MVGVKACGAVEDVVRAVQRAEVEKVEAVLFEDVAHGDRHVRDVGLQEQAACGAQ